MTLREFFSITWNPNIPDQLRPEIVCNNGHKISVQGSSTNYSVPRNNGSIYSKLEIKRMNVNESFESFFSEYLEQNCNYLASYVPIEYIEAYIFLNGGMNISITFKNCLIETGE